MTDTLSTTIRYHDGMRFNIAPNGKRFVCKFMEPGFVSYKDVGGRLELLRKETLDRCMASIVGQPLIIGHTDVTRDNREELEHAVIDSWTYNAEDGWYYVEGPRPSDRACELIRCGWKPSSGYVVTRLLPGGMDHGIRYDQEIADLEFNHLAIVERPRYAGSDFRLNSQNMNIVKFLKKLVTRENGADGQPVETVKMEPTDISAETEIDIDGQKVRLNELFQTHLAETVASFTASPEDAFEVSGKMVTMGELVGAYRKKAARDNEQKLVADKLIADKAAADKAAADAEAAKGRENFQLLQGARLTPPKIDGGFSTTSNSLKEKCERGSKRY